MAHRRICAVLLCMLCMSLAYAAPGDLPRYDLSIRAGLPLDEALQELARQSGIQIVFFSKITAGRSAPELSGKYTLAAAMRHLLAGSDLTYRQVNDHTLEVRQAPPRSGRVPRKAQAAPSHTSGDQLQAVTVVAMAEQLVATRVPTPLQEIPQSISVISSEQIREQNSVDLGDVLENTPGIAVRQTDSLDVTAYSRALQVVTYHVDGGSALKPMIYPQYLYYGDNPDLSEFDHVEVLRGSDALFSSNSEPGGTLSLVRKRPLATPSLEMSATLGSWNNHRIELDATGPLTDDGALRARTDIVYATRDYFFDRAYLDRKKAFAVVEYDLTPTSTLTAGGSYQWDDALPLFTPIPAYSGGRDSHLPRSTSLTFPWAFYNTRIGNAYLQYRQRFADSWILRLNTSAARTTVAYGYGLFGPFLINPASPNLGSPSALFSTRPDNDTLGTMDATLTGKLDWFGLQERIAIGADFMRIRGRQDYEGYASFGPPLTNVLEFDPQLYPDPQSSSEPPQTTYTVEEREMLQQYGGFVALQVDLNHAWTLAGGGRVASDTYRTSLGGASDGLSVEALHEASDAHVPQPYGALMYRINGHLSWYASYADIYLAQDDIFLRSEDGTPLGPQHGVTLESGIKGAWREGALNAYLAMYRVEQRDVPVLTQEEPSGNLSSSRPTFCCWTGGTGLSRGLELGVDGELAPGWLIGSGYAYNLYATGTPQAPATSTPRHLLKIWTSARLSGVLSRWTIGGSLHAQTAPPGTNVELCSTQRCVLGTSATLRPYAVLDLRAGYQFNRNWQVALSVNNILDKRYYLSQDTPALSLWYGDPRNVMLRIDAKF